VLSSFSKPFEIILIALKDWWRDWVNMAALNLGWLLCWATIILGPPATFTLYEIAHEFVNGKSFEYRELPRMMRRHFLRSWLWLLLNVCLAFGVYLNLLYYSRLAPLWNLLLLLLTLWVALAWIVVQFYALPFLMASQKPQLFLAFRNAFLTMLASPWYSLVMLVFILLLAALMSRLIALLFVGLPLLVVVLGSHAVRERLEHFQIK
jgi:uncharacterized membrane protein YesL